MPKRLKSFSLMDATQLLSDDPEMESSLHYMQLLLLVTCLEWLCCDKNAIAHISRTTAMLGIEPDTLT